MNGFAPPSCFTILNIQRSLPPLRERINNTWPGMVSPGPLSKFGHRHHRRSRFSFNFVGRLVAVIMSVTGAAMEIRLISLPSNSQWQLSASPSPSETATWPVSNLPSIWLHTDAIENLAEICHNEIKWHSSQSPFIPPLRRRVFLLNHR